MKIYRSLLFIPANKPKWMSNISNLSADAIILDLEDSVPNEEKVYARKKVVDTLSNLDYHSSADIFVRINRLNNKFDEDDLLEVLHPNLTGIVIPKVYEPVEINQLSSKIQIIESTKGITEGQIKLLPLLETAKSMYFCYDIAICDRVIGIVGLSSKNGDAERALGTKWTFEGQESLYMKSKVVMAARAAGITPIGGLWQEVHNLEGLIASAQKNRQLGFDGELILHPSNIDVINQTYSPSKEDADYYRGLIEAFNKAKESGSGAVVYDGSHIDYAHVQTAKNILSLYNTFYNSDSNE